MLEANAALPVSLLTWNAAINNDNVVLAWRSSFEANIAYYEVQHSTDGSNFTNLGKVPARNSATGSSYSFNHPGFVKGKNYYRLATKDADGNTKYSNILIIYAGGSKGIESFLFPNPANGTVSINMRGELKGEALVSVFDLSGKQLMSFRSGNLATSNYSTLLNIETLSKGVYMIEFKLGGYRHIKKLLVQ